MLFNLPLAHNLNLVGTSSSTTYPYGLCVDGIDVISKVPVDSISITEAGPGAVSSMQFTVLDVDSTVSPAQGAQVRMWDYVRDRPVFLGFIETLTITPWAAQGRTLTISVCGIEALLDMVIVPSLTVHIGDQASDAGTSFRETDMVQLLGGFSPLRQGNTLFSHSTQATPVGWIELAVVIGPDIVLDGMTVRQAYEAWATAAYYPWPDRLSVSQLTVDFSGGLRFWGVGGQYGTLSQPSDYATLTITDTTAGSVAAGSLTYTVDTSPSAITNAVYVKGATAASTGWVVGDTTTGRREGYTTTTDTTTEGKSTAATQVLMRHGGPAGRGSIGLENYVPTNVHPGSLLVITDARMGWAAKTMVVTQISKTIRENGNQDWMVSFADPVLSPAVAGPALSTRLVRTHTRATLN